MSVPGLTARVAGWGPGPRGAAVLSIGPDSCLTPESPRCSPDSPQTYSGPQPARPRREGSPPPAAAWNLVPSRVGRPHGRTASRLTPGDSPASTPAASGLPALPGPWSPDPS